MSRKTLFAEVKKRFPRQPLTGKGITLEYLRGLLEQNQKTSNKTVIHSVPLSTQDLVLSYLPDDKAASLQQVAYHRFQRYLQSSLIPPLNPYVDNVYLFKNFRDVELNHDLPVEFVLMLTQMSSDIKEYLPILRWILSNYGKHVNMKVWYTATISHSRLEVLEVLLEHTPLELLENDVDMILEMVLDRLIQVYEDYKDIIDDQTQTPDDDKLVDVVKVLKILETLILAGLSSKAVRGRHITAKNQGRYEQILPIFELVPKKTLKENLRQLLFK